MDQNVVDLCAKFYRRSNLGFKKYGCTTKRTDLTEKEWLIHLQEELMDACVYLQKVIGDKEK